MTCAHPAHRRGTRGGLPRGREVCMNCGEVVLSSSRRRQTTGPILAMDRHGDMVEVEQLAPEETSAPAATIDPSRLIDRPDDDMKLPMGSACRDCASFKRCEWLVGALPNATSCDWSPSRFRPRAKP